MTEIWVDAQLSPALAAWVNRTYEEITAKSVRAVGLRDAEDAEIFQAAREAKVIMMSKDSDFLNLLDRYGQPPKVIWVTSEIHPTSECEPFSSRCSSQPLRYSKAAKWSWKSEIYKGYITPLLPTCCLRGRALPLTRYPRH